MSTSRQSRLAELRLRHRNTPPASVPDTIQRLTRRLLKDLQSEEPERRDAALDRVAKLPWFQGQSLLAGSAAAQSIRLKHAYQVLARERGAPDWATLKVWMEAAELAEEFFAAGTFPAYWNIWFARHDRAREVAQETGGYVFPFREQFFVCDEHFVSAAGMDPQSPDWEAIGRDFARPENLRAWKRLAKALKQAREERAQHSASPASTFGNEVYSG